MPWGTHGYLVAGYTHLIVYITFTGGATFFGFAIHGLISNVATM